MQVINKKTIIVIFICLSIFIFGLFKLFNKEKVVLDDVILDINNSKDSLAIYIEEYDEEGNASYVESKDSKFPLDNNYVYNKELSGCLDSNSNEVEDALNYNYVNKELNLRVNKPVTCYVYYDYKGEGTEKVPYKIRSIEDLLDLSLSTNNGNKHTNEYFELTRDLDFRDKNSYNDSERTDYGNLNGITDDNNALINEMTTGTGWIPIGETKDIGFQGIFDGNNKNLKNIYINIETSQEQLGLFRYAVNSTIKNINLYGNINTKLKADTGALIGKTYDTTIENVNNYVNITSMVGAYALGGIVGAVMGGNVIVKNCINYGNITNSNNAGGLVGYTGGSLIIEDSHNEGIVTNSLGYHAGGLLGRDNAATNTTTILNSYNSGKVIINGSDRYTSSGGFIGKLIGNLYINNSYNKGGINVNTASTVNQVNVGGLIGYDGGKTIITNSHNEGNIMGGNRVGGLVGIGWDKSIAIIDKSYNAGNLTPSENSNWNGNIHVGGITSYAYNSAQLYLFNSYNTGNVQSNSTKGSSSGIIENIDGTSLVSIINSYNTGNIKNSYNGRGIVLFNFGTIKINNVYNMGDFESVTAKYGIGEFKGPGYTINKAYYKNNDNISGSNITNEEIIGKNLNEMQSNEFVTELNKNIESITLTDYIDNTLLTEFKTTTGYDLTLSKWTLKDGHPVLAF